ncbi:MAG TPA: hypothetical protein VHL98_18270 [Microvirga sp.]|nr:hypothetical protein [Microvirga sp.]
MEFIWIIGLALLGGAMFYFGSRQRRLSRAEQARSDAAARQNWGKEEIR